MRRPGRVGVTCLGRMMAPTDITAFQGMSRVITQMLLYTNPGETNFGRAIGDVMSLCALTRLFVKLLPYVGLANAAQAQGPVGHRRDHSRRDA